MQIQHPIMIVPILFQSTYSFAMLSRNAVRLRISANHPSSRHFSFAALAASSSPEQRTKSKKLQAKAKRKELLGLAKAVDRGGPHTITYDPGHIRNGENKPCFQAVSGLPDLSKPLFTVLGIESSCDDTGAAVIRSDGKILGEALAKQCDIHEAWGGVVPGLARDAHVENIERVVQEAVAMAGIQSINEIDAISVTVGPGLEICLRVGCEKAAQLAIEYNKPFVGVHHLEAHILMARLPLFADEENDVDEIKAEAQFPFLTLLVSGGHCQLLVCTGIGQYEVLGGTIDDSLGEAYDKVARMLGLPVGGGGGPAVEKLAAEGDSMSIKFSIPMQARKDCDFSYAGLKTNFRRSAEKLVVQRKEEGALIDSISELPREDKANLAASFQFVAIRHLEDRLRRAMDSLERSSRIRTLAVVGGVAANQELRSRLQAVCTSRSESWEMLVPPPRLCTDQGAMSAWAGVERLLVGSSDDPFEAEVFARYPFATKPKQ